MGDNWDDEDFEPDVQSLAPPKEPEPEAAQPASSGAPKPVKKNEINMESLNRELSAAEREEMQRRQDFAMAKEMFGGDTDETARPYSDILSKEEFEEWGTNVGKFLATRHKAAHYGDMCNKLLTLVAEKLDSKEIRVLSNHLKALADAKKDDKPKAGTAPNATKQKKIQLKGAKKGGNSMMDDIGGGGRGYDDFDDDDFM